MSLDGELQIPEPAYQDHRSVEILRAWSVDDAVYSSVRVDVPNWSDPGAWGIMLVDLARYFAHAYGQSLGVDPDEVFDQIREELEARMEELTE
jgi:hypothetical protein